jgi:beta-galactosidase
MGRCKFDLENQSKGLFEDVLIDGNVQKDWEMFALDFKQDFLEKVKKDKWSPISDYKEPTLYRAILEIKDEPKDTYLKLDVWQTTVVFINEFNIGKYYDVGPQKTLYVPATLLKKGENEILLFETSRPTNQIELIDHPIWDKI